MSWLKNLVGKGGDSTGATLEAPAFSAPLATEELVAVVGDIHGRIDLLDAMVGQLGQLDIGTCVFVGDYVDRGDHSAEVLVRLKDLTESYSNIVCLRGNHEKMLLDFIDRPRERADRWLRNGGLQTLASFGMSGLRDTMHPEEAEILAQEFRTRMPDGLEDWLRERPLHFNSGNLWVVHAAADPDAPIAGQSDRILLWGHKRFRRQPRLDGNWVAHGHTIVEQPIAENGVISIDTGAYATGRLTAAVVDPTHDPVLRFLST